jgi:hypothetical protein
VPKVTIRIGARFRDFWHMLHDARRLYGAVMRVPADAPAAATDIGNALHGAPMTLRDVKAASVGAALGAVALMSLQEGRVAISRASENVKVNAGETERADPIQATHTTDGVGEVLDPAMAANANLAEQVQRYRERLDAIGAQKTATEKQLAEVQKKLATLDGKGGPARIRSEYDLSQEDWKKLAAEGTVKIQTPCDDSRTYDVAPSSLAEIGLPASDAQPIHDALRDSSWRLWSVVRALCAQGLHGNLQLADELGPEACRGLIEHMGHRDGGDLQEQVRIAAEIRAGLLPMPQDPASLGVYSQLLLAQSAESRRIEQQLTKSIGPDDAQAFVYGGVGCWERFTKSVGPRSNGPQ